MRKFLLIPALFLAGCKTVYVPVYVMPDVPAELMTPPSQHQTIEESDENS